ADTGAARLPVGVSCLSPDTPVLAPPSQRPTGRARWLWSPTFPRTLLPTAESLLENVGLAAMQQVELQR
ncbi:MAG TPA: hypothetical protein VGJ44_24985, partial [Kribbellaceae bacterium]